MSLQRDQRVTTPPLTCEGSATRGYQIRGQEGAAASSAGAHGALFDLAATWGVGGLLIDLERLTVQHGALPRVADELRVALAMFAAAYAPAGSTREAQAWRSEPCTLCAREVPGA